MAYLLFNILSCIGYILAIKRDYEVIYIEFRLKLLTNDDHVIQPFFLIQRLNYVRIISLKGQRIQNMLSILNINERVVENIEISTCILK